MKRLLLGVAILGLSVCVVVLAGAVSPSGRATGMNYGHLNQIQKKLASGAFSQALGPATPPCVNPPGEGDEGDEAGNECPPSSYASPSGTTASNTAGYFPAGSGPCSEKLGNNVKGNQNCQKVPAPDLAGRGQAQNETAIAINPNDPNNMIATQNDYRRGDGNCYGAYTRDGGHTWNDTTIPMSFTRGVAFG